MSDYTSVSLQKGLKEDLNRMKGDKETYSDVIHRALAALSEREDKQKRRHEEVNKHLRQQNRLLVRMAVAQGLEKPQIPRSMMHDESRGDTIEQADRPLDGMFIPRSESNEETLDLLADERQATSDLEFKAYDRIYERRKERDWPGRDEDEFPRLVGEEELEQEKKAIIEENPEKWADRATEVLDEEENAGGKPPWEADNGGDN